jgi:hypothetical protein
MKLLIIQFSPTSCHFIPAVTGHGTKIRICEGEMCAHASRYQHIIVSELQNMARKLSALLKRPVYKIRVFIAKYVVHKM